MAYESNTAPIVTDLNVDPYYDDYNETKNFHRILFRPGAAVQARELTQTQSILQNQISRFGGNIFKEGSSVRGCEQSIDRRYDSVKLRDKYGANTITVANFLNKTLKGNTSGVIATVVNVNDGSQANGYGLGWKTLFVKYLSGNTTTGFSKFANNEILRVVTAPDNSAFKANTITAAMSNTYGCTGIGTAITVGAGVIFAKSNFIRVTEQTLILNKYGIAATSARIGFTINEDIITSSDDETLLDPASGSYNYAAPGANRLKLSAVLTRKSLTQSISNNFIQIAEIKSGVLQMKNELPQYAAIRDYIAKRTSEESGNYIVHGFHPRVREHLRSGNNQGLYLSGGTPIGNNELIVISVEPGKAYVQGYDVGFLASQPVPIDKGIDYLNVNDSVIYADYGNYVIANNVIGNWDLETQDRVSLRSAAHFSVANATFSTTDFSGASIGTARVRGFEYYAGTPGDRAAQYKIYLTDINITTAGQAFSGVRSIGYTATGAGSGGYANGKADLVSSSLNDTAQDRAVFRLPARAVRSVRDSSGGSDINFSAYREFDTSFTSGVATLTLTGDETFAGTGVLSDTLARGYYVVMRESANTSTLTGTVSVTNSSNTVTGTATQFTNQINVGDVLRISNTGSAAHIVTSITSNTSLKVLTNAAVTRTGMSIFKSFIKGQVLDMGGVGRTGDRAVTVVSSTSTTVDCKETFGTPAAPVMSVIAKIAKADVAEATKAISRDKFVQLRIGTSGSGGYTGNTAGPWPLGVSDGFRVVSVRKQATTKFTSTTSGADVTTHFTLDSGQRDSFYDHAQLVKKPTSGLTISAGDFLLVKLDYFTHASRENGYFDFNSYPVSDSTAGSDTSKIYTYEVPIFTSPLDGSSYDLRDSIDFRPRVTDTANSTTSTTNISTNPLGLNTNVLKAASSSFDKPSGGLKFPPPATTFTSDFSYYLPRHDLIVLSKEGALNSVRGSSSLNPQSPPQPEDNMTVAVVSIAPYPSLPDEIARRAGRQDYANGLRTVKNERFTMRDIGAIRDRVDRIEYYTSLSLLEQQAQATALQDTNGIDRFKNGILVDSMTGHNVGNVYDPDYAIAIDPARREARPSFKLDNIEMFYNAANSANVVRTNVTVSGVSRDQILVIPSNNTYTDGETLTSGGQTATLRFQVGTKLYIENATANFAAAAAVVGGTSGTSCNITSVTATTPGRAITLPYTHEKVISQRYATTTRNIAGLLYNWRGVTTLTPRDDYWVDTVNQPEVQINIDNNSLNWQVLANAWGTQWSSWETVIGAPVAVGSPTEVITGVSSDGSNLITNFGISQDYATTTTSTQTGSSLGVSFTQQTQTIGSVVRDVNIQPFMRSKLIKFSTVAMKPSTRLYAFFDNVNVTEYVTPTNSSYANTANEGSKLTSDSSGNVYGIFRLPNDSSRQFRVGEKIFRLSDNLNNSSIIGSVTTSSEATYSASGLLQNKNNITFGTTHAELSFQGHRRASSTVGLSTVISPGGQSVVSLPAAENSSEGGENIRESGGGDNGSGGDNSGDPIAQTFSVDTGSFGGVSSSGGFLTKIDLFFATKDSSLPVIVEIREVDTVSGYPSPYVVPHARTIVPADSVNISDNGQSPTPIYFSSPVYLENGKQYATVVIPGGNNPNYSCWISRIGDTDVYTTERVVTQPTPGVLFASANDRTYTALQDEDLKINMYFANYNPLVTGTLVMKNETKDFMTVANLTGAFLRSGEVIHGETYMKGTFAPGQGLKGNVALGLSFVEGMTSGATGTIIYLSTANNDMRVHNVSTASKFKGGEAIRFRLASISGTITGNSTGAIRNVTTPIGTQSYYNNKGANTYLHIANVSFANSGPAASNNRMFTSNRRIRGQTNGYVARIVSLDSLNADVINFKTDYITPSNTSVLFSGKFAKSTSARDTEFTSINNAKNTEFAARRFIHSRSAESNTVATFSGMKDGSAEVKVVLETNNRYASPVFDVQRLSITLIENLINSTSDISTTEENVRAGGSAEARYITRRVTLKEDQDAEDLKLYLDAYLPPGSAVTTYYKAINGEDGDTFDLAKWVPMTRNTVDTEVSSESDRQDFREIEFSVPAYGAYNNGLFANSSPANILTYRNSKNAKFSGFKYFVIKVVLASTNTNNVPRFKNLRVIALQK